MRFKYPESVIPADASKPGILSGKAQTIATLAKLKVIYGMTRISDPLQKEAHALPGYLQLRFGRLTFTTELKKEFRP